MVDAVTRMIAELRRWAPSDGVHPTPIPGVACIKISRPQSRTKRQWRPSYCIVVQGTKEIALAGRTHRRTDAHYVASTALLPIDARVITATPARPFLALKLDLDTSLIREVAAQLEAVEISDDDLRPMFVGPASPRMLDAAARLVDLFATPADATVLAPLVMRELVFHLLKTPDGPALRQVVRSGSQSHRIADAVYRLQASVASAIDVDELAKRAGMSRAVFFRRFKDATTLSPLQYHKRLRLLEARRLMVEEGEGAEAAARRVGYGSASQFSREYARMFGDAPLRDTRALAPSALVDA